MDWIVNLFTNTESVAHIALLYAIVILKKKFWWYGMKREIAEHVAICDSCRRIKAEHQRPAGLLQPLQIPQWKWDEIGMDFIVGLPHTRAGYDSI